MPPESQLGALLAPLSLDEFTERHYGEEHLYLPGAAKALPELLSWERLNTILQRNRLHEPRVRLVQGGEVIATDRYTRTSSTNRGLTITQMVSSSVLGLLRDGATMVIEAVDEMEAAIEELAVEIEGYFRAKTSANAYIAFRDEPGFALHWDDHDAFIVQVHGHKRWQIVGPTRRYPMYRDNQRATSAPADNEGVTYLLEPGDVLYIPRGFWHAAMPLNEPTVHLALGFVAPTGIDLLTWLADELRAQEAFRRNLPHRGAADATRARSHALTLRRLLDDAWSDDVIERFLDRRDGLAATRARFDLPWSATEAVLRPGDDFSIRLVSPRGRLHDVADGQVSLLVDGREVTFSAVVRPFLELLVDGRAHHFKEALASIGEAEVAPTDMRRLVAELVSCGVVVTEAT